jgi:hypothetical protein
MESSWVYNEWVSERDSRAGVYVWGACSGHDVVCDRWRLSARSGKTFRLDSERFLLVALSDSFCVFFDGECVSFRFSMRPATLDCAFVLTGLGVGEFSSFRSLLLLRLECAILLFPTVGK